ncbi:hypothetical protein VB796_01810 [Arcicella sp. LKC2W]|uniref:hypothetical protein n=1 Tax=Arcicella sp. LKC2W TaxID=2984198 RepID=UPI002B1F6D29|nr:hypothetical protein [Arcicella sp. LKC2W]MEA5457753.1 hypothetical protein [Arcicella sp. LKC2W]
MRFRTDNQGIKKRYSISLRRFVKGEMRLDNYANNEILRYIILSRTDFREYLEHQFLEGMTWDNYCSAWEIDHIIPVGEFDMTNEDDLKLCWHYLNLMPLIRKDNEIKAHSLYFAKIELEKRLKVLPSNPILKALKEKTNNDEIHTKYNYDLEFLKFYNSINYH